jgi:autotransporter translocation and assembly factor TamB
MTRKTLFLVFISCLTVILVAAAGIVYYVLETPGGLQRITPIVFDRFVPARKKSFGAVEGTLATTITLKNVELSDPRDLPAGSVIKIQQLTITPHGFNYQNADVTITNARLKLPVSDNIVVDGNAKDRLLNVKIFSPAIDLEEVLSLIPNRTLALKTLKGSMTGLDLQINGPLKEPRLVGRFLIERLARPDLQADDCPGAVDFAFKNLGRHLRLKGEIGIEKGKVQARRTKITLKPSKIYFSGNPKSPSLSIDAYSRIDTLDVDIRVAGTADKPVLKLTSDPPLSEQEIMVALATGKKWEGLQSLEQGQVSAGLVKELAGYLFASDSGDGFFAEMGITDVKVIMDKDKKAVGFTKEVSDKVDLDYELEQKGPSPGAEHLSQTIGADYRVTNTFFASIERQLQVLSGLQGSEPEGADDRLLMKYKTRF